MDVQWEEARAALEVTSKTSEQPTVLYVVPFFKKKNILNLLLLGRGVHMTMVAI